MAIQLAAFPDSELEVLRRSKNDEDDEALDLEARLPFWRAQGKKLPMKKAAGQQAGWLAVGIIVRFLDGTPVGTKGDWKDLAGCLGLDILTINRIDNFASSRTGATLEVLSDYTMSQKSTVGELVEALHTLGRMDVLLAISPHLELLLDPSKRSPSPASFKSLPPALMSSSSEDEMVVRVEGQPDMPNLESSPFVMMGSSPPTKELSPTRIRKYVMLTFAQDGYELAKEVAALARTSLSHLGLGILILEENREELEFCTESIYRWYQEVDYIIPIISPGYLWQVAPRGGPVGEEEDDDDEPCLDSRYARLIYVMMNQELLKDGCLNWRVRPIESDILTAQQKQNPILTNPLFSCRKKVPQVERLLTILAESKTSRR